MPKLQYTHASSIGALAAMLAWTPVMAQAVSTNDGAGQ